MMRFIHSLFSTIVVLAAKSPPAAAGEYVEETYHILRCCHKIFSIKCLNSLQLPTPRQASKQASKRRKPMNVLAKDQESLCLSLG